MASISALSPSMLGCVQGPPPPCVVSTRPLSGVSDMLALKSIWTRLRSSLHAHHNRPSQPIFRGAAGMSLPVSNFYLGAAIAPPLPSPKGARISWAVVWPRPGPFWPTVAVSQTHKELSACSVPVRGGPRFSTHVALCLWIRSLLVSVLLTPISARRCLAFRVSRHRVWGARRPICC